MINNLKDLTQLLKLCRAQGVLEIDVHGVKLKLGDLPPPPGARTPEMDPENPYQGFPVGELTPEQLMFYSSGGLPENDPVLKAKDA